VPESIAGTFRPSEGVGAQEIIGTSEQSVQSRLRRLLLERKSSRNVDFRVEGFKNWTTANSPFD
jgi:hypothetical protein